MKVWGVVSVVTRKPEVAKRWRKGGGWAAYNGRHGRVTYSFLI